MQIFLCTADDKWRVGQSPFMDRMVLLHSDTLSVIYCSILSLILDLIAPKMHHIYLLTVPITQQSYQMGLHLEILFDMLIFDAPLTATWGVRNDLVLRWGKAVLDKVWPYQPKLRVFPCSPQIYLKKTFLMFAYQLTRFSGFRYKNLFLYSFFSFLALSGCTHLDGAWDQIKTNRKANRRSWCRRRWWGALETTWLYASKLLWCYWIHHCFHTYFMTTRTWVDPSLRFQILPSLSHVVPYCQAWLR